MSVRTIRNLGGVVLAGGLVFGSMGALAQSDSSTPDAQIESNVLKALASASDLSAQNIQTSTVYGTVTLTGNVQSEALRTEAENLAARSQGVKKVVDELTLGDTPPPTADDQGDQSAQNQPMQGQDQQQGPPQGNQGPPQDNQGPPQGNQVLQSDGTYAPASNGSGAPPPAPDNGQYAQNGAAPPPQDGYPQQQDQPSGRQPMNQGYGAPQNAPPVPGGQRAGLQVTVPPGSMLRIRINRGLDSNHTEPGSNFDGTVLTDVVADGAVAIPRGATVSGTVISSKRAGVFKGEGELSLQITSLTLGGQVYPLATDIWAHTGRDKTPGTVTNTVGLGAIGALIGGAAGGGAGAAIGAGVGVGAGLAGSAASPRGALIVPPETVLTFRTANPVSVRTVSEREMERLSYSAGPQQPQGPPLPPRYYNGYYGPPQ